MQVKVYSPSKVYYAGRAFSITATNATGEFDVLPQHHRFISLLDECQLMVRTTKHGNQKINISGGLMHVRENRVIIFLDI
jgi:F0F1-type ATP synthase epsilon subunit